MQEETIKLTGAKETLFITLLAKALESRSKNSILRDTYADEILRSINYDFSKHSSFGRAIIVMRSKQYDDWVIEFISRHEDAVVAYIGCGLDTRIKRIAPPPTVSWFDIDYPDVIELRRKFFSESAGYTMIESSATDPGWLQKLPSGRPVIVIAEGLLEYIDPDDVKTLLNRITRHFSKGEIAFDVMSSFAVKSATKNLKETTGAVLKWAVNDPQEVDRLNPALTRRDDLSVFRLHYISNLPFRERVTYRFMSMFKRMRNMIRLMRYKF